MKNAVIYVFSGTGNTLKIVQAYADEFFRQGVSCKIHILEKDGLKRFPPPENFDLTGIAYPVHAFNAPYVLHRFADALPYLPFKEYFILKSSGEPLAINNVSSGSLVAKLERKGYFLTNEYHYVMPYNMIFRHSDGMATKMWKIAEQLCAVEAREILDGKKHFLKPFPFGRSVSALFRIEQPAMKINGAHFKVSDKCIGCGKCAENCPVENISVSDGIIKFGKKCIMCARCSFSCPLNAISIALLNGWKVNGSYDFESRQSDCERSVPDFLKVAYEKYFRKAEEKIALAKADYRNPVPFSAQDDESAADLPVTNNH